MMGMNENQKHERGMAAIIVTIIMMIVISIIVLGFAQVVRREQRNSLDNQLSTQAYYAAESGVNLAQSKLLADPSLPEKDDCDESGVFVGEFDIGENAEITCLLIDKKLPTLEYQNVGMYSIPMLIQAETGNIGKITFSWESPTSTRLGGCATGGNFQADAAAGGDCQPVLRLDLVPIGAGATTPNAVKNSQFTTFLYPITTASSPIQYTDDGTDADLQGVHNVQCTATGSPKKCTAVIQVAPSNRYAARVMSLYGDANLTVFAEDTSAVRVDLINGQAQLDVTAKASDVLKRVQARMSLYAPIPDFGVTAGGEGVCKRYQKIGSDISIDGSHPACNIP